MKISKARLIQIIKEEIEEAAPVGGGGGYGSPSRFLKKRPKNLGLEPTLAMEPHRKTQVVLPAGDKYKQMLQIIKARLGPTVNDEQAKKLAKELSDTLTGEEK